ncbi:DUF7147 family protein [Pseudalkalibacillus berkeleyi]|uniref:Methylthioribose kinase n=1 Tax=Pseudalkalibacillus berkeleyi TaxID=1069813 RepID=A0ABS9GZM7_9BACL|nr:methylthioribose kinase [Pseudalkalibacillus berkeleyi]MCF6136987.1 methylthioribose kinase [Pseudalkalibacillus berkeleyi]
MIQRFIELGEGYSDLYELIELAKTNANRLSKMVILKTNKKDHTVCSFSIVLQPAGDSNFQPIYICREGIREQSKRWDLFLQCAEQLGKEVHTLEVRPSNGFNEIELYYQYLTGILRLQNIIPKWQ